MIPKLRELWKKAFGDTDAFLDIFWQWAYDQNRCRYIAMEGIPAAALYWFDCEILDSTSSALRKVAYIYAVATDPKYRGQGLCHKLMEETHRHLERHGYDGAILVPGSESLYDFYGGMGYQVCTFLREVKVDLKNWKNLPKTETMEKTVSTYEIISKEEFARLRRGYLPEGAVLQEKENLDFLDQLALFYKGEDFLMAATEEEGILRGVEFLGNEKRFKEMLFLLGYTKGVYRTIGTKEPFAMYYPLRKEASFPSYFGIPFD